MVIIQKIQKENLKTWSLSFKSKFKLFRVKIIDFKSISSMRLKKTKMTIILLR